MLSISVDSNTMCCNRLTACQGLLSVTCHFWQAFYDSSVTGTVHCEQTLADSPAESELRFKSRAVLPGYAKYLREVGPAVNVILNDQGLDYDAQLSSRYGGAGEDTSPAEALLERIGETITLSGRCDSCMLTLSL